MCCCCKKHIALIAASLGALSHTVRTRCVNKAMRLAQHEQNTEIPLNRSIVKRRFMRCPSSDQKGLGFERKASGRESERLPFGYLIKKPGCFRRGAGVCPRSRPDLFGKSARGGGRPVGPSGGPRRNPRARRAGISGYDKFGQSVAAGVRFLSQSASRGLSLDSFLCV